LAIETYELPDKRCVETFEVQRVAELGKKKK
jgi:hypothetical protein